MFRANEKLTGRQFTYDGNPQRFGEYDSRGGLITGRGNTAAAIIATLSSSGSIEVKGEVGPKHGGMAATATGTTDEEEEEKEKGAGGKGADGSVEGVDHLDGFQFDAQDILAALQF